MTHPHLPRPGREPLTALIKVPILALYSRDLYREVACHWHLRRGLLYLLMLVAVCWLPVTVVWRVQGDRFMAREADAYIRQLPTITVGMDGKASVDASQPVIIHDQATGEARMIIDTTGEVTSLHDSPAVLLLTSRQLLVRRADGGTQALDLRQVPGLVLTPEDARWWLGFTLRWGPLLLYPVLVLMASFSRLVQALAIGLIGGAVRPITGCLLPLQRLIPLAMVAVTPASLLAAALLISRIHTPLGWLPAFAVSMGYMLYAMSTVTPEPVKGS